MESANSSPSPIKATLSSNSLLSKKLLAKDQNQTRYFLSVQVGPAEIPEGGQVTQAVYTVTYRTNIADYATCEGSAVRRFADFVELWSRLRERYAQFGVAMPPRPPDRPLAEAAKARLLGASRTEPAAPPGSPSAAAAVAVGSGVTFAERRRARLARFLARCAEHHSLRTGRELRDFLEGGGSGEQPAGGPARSGGIGVVRALASSIGDSVAMLNFQGVVNEEPDEWVDGCTEAIEEAAGRLNRLRACLDSISSQRRAYAGQAVRLAQSLGKLAGAESEPGLALGLTRLSESLTGLAQVQASQADSEELELCDLLADQSDGLAGERECLTERGRARRAVAVAESALTRRRELHIRAQLAGREASGPTPAELEQLEDEVERRQGAFDAVTEAARKELARCERRRSEELRAAVARVLRRQVEGTRRLLAALEAAEAETGAFLDDSAEEEILGSRGDGGSQGLWLGTSGPV